MFVYTVRKGFKEQIQPATVLDILTDYMHNRGWVMIAIWFKLSNKPSLSCLDWDSDSVNEWI